MSKTIFLVEDDQDDQAFFVEAVNTIENASLYQIANNGQDALDKLEKESTYPDLIFMDINMPLMNGLDCLLEITKDPRIQNIPVIMLSTSNNQQDEARKMGARAFLKKGSDQKVLKSQIEMIINFDFTIDHTTRFSFS